MGAFTKIAALSVTGVLALGACSSGTEGEDDGAKTLVISSDLPEVLAETLALGAPGEGGASTLWLQLGSWHEDVAREAQAAGLDVVMDRCVKIEHARFHGGLHLAGFDTGVISSRRQLRA